ncbi:MAG TPA: autotransporter-associated beta strand repeat-containing protein, partial [Kiritimatiellia bacterium]|nr:autotransporter-associated beta strand repeat-containing protein [Kiritimatiellia bacterium]
SYGCLSLHAVDTVDTPVALLGSLSLKRIILEPYAVADPVQTLRFDGTGPGLSIGTSSGEAFSLRCGNSSSSGLFTFIMDIADSPDAPIDLLVPFMNFRPHGTMSGFHFIKRGAGVMQVNGLDWSLANDAGKPIDGIFEAGTLIWNTSAVNPAGVNFATVTVDSGATLQVGAGGAVGAIFVDAAVNGTLAFNRSNACLFTHEVSGSGRLVQKGKGTLTLTGTHTYSGGTEVEDGTLLVVAPGALNGAGTVSVTGGTLGGDGIIAGPVAIDAGGTLMPGGIGTIGTLTLAHTGADALTLADGRLLCDLGGEEGNCDRIEIAGALALDGTSRLALAFTDTPPAGTYTLLTYAAKSGTGTLVLDRPYPNATLTVGETAVTLTVTGAGITYLTWTGATSDVWDTATENWTLLGEPAAFTAGDPVLFNDTASVFTVGASGAVTPSIVMFDNSAEDYSIAAQIGGAGTPLIKKGTKSVTLSGANTYGGGTFLEDGFLTVDSTANLPATGPLMFQGGVLRFSGAAPASLNNYTVNWDSFNGGFELTSGTLTINNTISGNGSLSKSGAGSLILGGENRYSGGTVVKAGYLSPKHNHALGVGHVTVASGGQVDLTGNLTITNAVSIKGVGATSSGEGAIRSVNGTTNTWSGPVTLQNSSRLGCLGGGLLEISGVIDSGTNNYDLVVRMPNTAGGTLLLSNNNTWRGNTWVRCGTVKLGIDNALPTGTVLQLGLNASQTDVKSATLDLAGFNQSLAGVVDSGSDNHHLVTNTEETFSTLTINTTSARSFAGEFAGNLNIVKTGASDLTLSGTSSTFGDLIVSNGTVIISSTGSLGPNCTNITVATGILLLQNSSALADEASLFIANDGVAKVNLAEGVNETVGYLYFGDKLRMGGTYGATGSGAAIIDDEHFLGKGVLSVRHGKGGTVIRLR